MEKFNGQVVTELDEMRAVYEYIISQLDGRFRVQFPAHTEFIDTLIENMQNPFVQITSDQMQVFLFQTVEQFTEALSSCAIQGCPHEGKHVFIREFINLVWDARDLTEEWLKGQGVVPGQSTN
jgi:hypothetical protein